MSDIFLSYAREDQERVRPLAEALMQEGWSVFWDRTIPIGKMWHKILSDELDACKCFVVVWSKHSIESEWVLEEAGLAKRKGLAFAPILLDAVEPPLGYQLIQAADLSAWDGSPTSALLQNLALDIKKILGPVPEIYKPASPGAVPTEPKPVKPEQPELRKPETPEPERGSRSGLILLLAGLALILLMVGVWWFYVGGLSDDSVPPRSKEAVKNGRLFVETAPKSASIKLLNIRAKFVQGMELKPGSYHVEVEADGFETKREWVGLNAGEEKHFPIKLTESKPPPPPQPPSSEDIEVQPAKEFTNSIGMKFVFIPAGTFQMGSPAGEPGRIDDERKHQVTISQPFYLQTTQVTQGQWQRVMGKNPSKYQQCGKDCPVERVSWEKANQFIAKLNQMENTDKYRLPTEAEWEYACRAGSTTRFSFGDDEAKLGEYAWYNKNSGHKTHPVGQKKPNAWGLYDMHGNVHEWCQDWYGKYPIGTITDPKGPTSGKDRTLRGGGHHNDASWVRSAFRGFEPPEKIGMALGLRVAKSL